MEKITQMKARVGPAFLWISGRLLVVLRGGTIRKADFSRVSPGDADLIYRGEIRRPGYPGKFWGEPEKFICFAKQYHLNLHNNDKIPPSVEQVNHLVPLKDVVACAFYGIDYEDIGRYRVNHLVPSKKKLIRPDEIEVFLRTPDDPPLLPTF